VSRILPVIFACIAGPLIFSGNLAAQSDTPEPLKIGDVTVSGLVHERYEDWNFFRGAKGENDYGYSGSYLRLMFSEKTKTFDWAVEFAAPILLGIPNQAVQGSPLGQLGLGGAYYAANRNNTNAASVFLKQGYMRLKGAHSSLRLGRFEFTDGGEVTPKDETLAIVKRDGIAQRLIGTFGFSDVNAAWMARSTLTPTAIGMLPPSALFPIVESFKWMAGAGS